MFVGKGYPFEISPNSSTSHDNVSHSRLTVSVIANVHILVNFDRLIFTSVLTLEVCVPTPPLFWIHI